MPYSPSVPMMIEPGAWLAIQEEMLELERQWRARQAAIEEERTELQAKEMELRLATSPIDYVAYQQYLRQREAAGKPTYSGAAATDPEIRGMVRGMAGGPSISPLGAGEFGVRIPRTSDISRAEATQLSPDEMDILSSFLKAGFTPFGGEKTSYDPADYWREVEKGFIPTVRTPAATRYAY